MYIIIYYYITLHDLTIMKLNCLQKYTNTELTNVWTHGTIT